MILRLTIAVVMLTGPLALAQEERTERVERPRASHDEVARLIDAYLLMNIQERLELTTDQFNKILPLISKLQKDRRHFAKRRFEALQNLRQLLEKGGASEQSVTEIMDDLRALEAQGPLTIQKEMEAIDAILTPVQQAKYRVLESEVERKIREARNRVRSGVSPGRRDRLPRIPHDAPSPDQP